MRFVRRPESAGQRPDLPPPPGERLVRRTGFGLAVFTLALIATLLAAIGLVTAAAAVQITDLSVDSNLHTAAENMLTALAPTPSPTPLPTLVPGTPEPTFEPTTTPEETSSGEDTSPAGDGENDGGSRQSRSTPLPVPTPLPAPTAPPPPPTPAPTVPPTTLPTPTSTSTPTATPVPGSGTTDERPPGSSDTFFLILDPSGGVVANPQRVALTSLPSAEAAAVSVTGAEDWRTVEAGRRARQVAVRTDVCPRRLDLGRAPVGFRAHRAR